jgi:hypothetical protein
MQHAPLLLLLLQAFEETQGKLDEELASRTARELALLEEEAARRAAEEEAARWGICSAVQLMTTVPTIWNALFVCADAARGGGSTVRSRRRGGKVWYAVQR